MEAGWFQEGKAGVLKKGTLQKEQVGEDKRIFSPCLHFWAAIFLGGHRCPEPHGGNCESSPVTGTTWVEGSSLLMPRYCLTSEGRAQGWDKRALGPEYLHPLLSWAADNAVLPMHWWVSTGLSTEDAQTRGEDMWRLCNVSACLCVCMLRWGGWEEDETGLFLAKEQVLGRLREGTMKRLGTWVGGVVELWLSALEKPNWCVFWPVIWRIYNIDHHANLQLRSKRDSYLWKHNCPPGKAEMVTVVLSQERGNQNWPTFFKLSE